MEALLSHYRSPSLPGLPPLHGGLVGYLGYDVVREVERLPDAPPDELGYPDAILSVVGQVAAYDAWRQRVTLVEAVPVPAGHDHRRGPRPVRLGACARLEELRSRGRQAHRRAGDRAARPRRRAAPVVDRRTSPQLYAAAVEAAQEYILAGDIFQVVLAQRFDLDLGAEPFDLYRSLRQVNPSPYMYFLQYPELAVVGSSPEPMVRSATGGSISRPDRRHPPAGPDRRGRPAPGGRAVRAPEGAGRARHAGRPGPQRRRPGGRVRHRDGRRADDPGALQPRHAPDLAGVGPAAARARAGRRAAGHACRPGPSRARPRCGPWRSSTSSSRPSGARTPAWSATSTSPATSTPPSPSAPCSSAPTGGPASQAGAGIVADSVAEDEDLECRNKAAALLAAVPGARRIAAARAASRAALAGTARLASGRGAEAGGSR